MSWRELSLAALAAAVPLQAEVMHDPVVLSFCRMLVKKAAAERFREQSAFVVRTAEGIVYFVAWPAGTDPDEARWQGPFPEGTIAIVHTHPPWLPEPSKIDVRTARRARVPVYVITPSGIARTTGGTSEVVVQGQWAGSP